MRAALHIEPDVGFPLPRGSSTSVLDQIVFYGVFGLLGFAPLAFGAVDAWAVFLVEAVSALLFALWLISQVKSGELRVTESPLFAPMAVFGSLVLIQLLTRHTAYRYQTMEQGLVYCSYGLICFVVVQCFRRTSQVGFLAVAASVYGTVVAVFGIFQSVSSASRIYWLKTPTFGGWIYGPYVNHNHYAGLMEMLVPIPLVAGITEIVRRRRRLQALTAAALMASTIFLCGSRGGMIAFLAQMMVLGVFLIGKRKSRMTVLALSGFAVLVFGLMVWLGGSQLGERLMSIRGETGTEISGGTRLAIVRDGLKMFTAKPILGWGLGTFPDAFPQYRTFYTNLFVNEAHNDYLQLLVEMGVLGFATMLWFLIETGRRAARKLAHWPSNVNGATTLAAILGCTGILVHSLVDFNLQVPANAAWFYVLCTLAAMEPRFPILHHRPGFRRGSEPTSA